MNLKTPKTDNAIRRRPPITTLTDMATFPGVVSTKSGAAVSVGLAAAVLVVVKNAPPAENVDGEAASVGVRKEVVIVEGPSAEDTAVVGAAVAPGDTSDCTDVVDSTVLLEGTSDVTATVLLSSVPPIVAHCWVSQYCPVVQHTKPQDVSPAAASQIVLTVRDDITDVASKLDGSAVEEEDGSGRSSEDDCSGGS